ncbi:hypothetical protein EV126DRAFT_342225, partial [Verticillium dahliae]
VLQRREEYFLKADKLRAKGYSTEHLVNRKTSQKAGRYTTSSAAATQLSGYMLRCSESDTLTIIKYIDILMAFLLNRFSEVEHLERMSTTISTNHEFRCLLGCGPMHSRYSLSRHVQRRHKETFRITFFCPECLSKSQGKRKRIIDGQSEWSTHVERYHGKHNSPYSPRQSPLVKSGRSRQFKTFPKFAAGHAFSRHINSAHLAQGLFNEPFPCPECTIAGVEALINGIEYWREYTWEVHGYKGQTGRKKSNRETEAVGLDGMGGGRKSTQV